MTTQEICSQIVKCLENVWTDKMLFDFAVKIADETIQCHRLVLAACSEFFKALFRSGMREVTENCVVLQDVSTNVFQLIMKTIYTGSNLLTFENVFEVWRAVNQLQINFMVNVCEHFVIESITIDTWEKIYTHAKLLSSEKVIIGLRMFILKNFDQISLLPIFLQLSFNEVRDLIQSQDLVTVSEDLVLEAVIRWVKNVAYDALYTPRLSKQTDREIEKNNVFADITLAGTNHSEVVEIIKTNNDAAKQLDDVCCDASRDSPTVYQSRKDKLPDLIKLVRTCLVSPVILSRVYKMEIIYENNVLRNIIFDALYYVQNFRHGQWPTAAIQRACSDYIHAGVYEQNNGMFVVLSAHDEKLYNITKCNHLQENIQLVTLDGELYASGKRLNQPNEPSTLFVFCDNIWDEVLTMPGQNLLLLSHEQFIYILNKDDKTIYKVNSKKNKTLLEKYTDFKENMEIEYSMIFENNILIFNTETHNGIEQAAVHKVDISSKVWTKLDNLDGSAEQIISFRNDKHSYVLQTNGNLWCILNSPSNVNFELKFVSKLWNLTKKLYGALTYNDKLLVFGNHPKNDPPGTNRVTTLPGHIEKISYWGCDANCSNFIPITLPKTCLHPYK